MKRLLPLLAALMWLAIPIVHAAESPPLQLTAATRHASLAGHLALHVDAEGTLPFALARQAEYVPQKTFRSAGYTRDTYWYRFKLARDDNAPRDWVLAMGAPYLNDVRAWVALPDGQFHEYRLGDHVAYSQRPLQTRMFALRLDLHDTMPLEIYVRVHSVSAIIFSAEVWQPDAFVADETRTNFYHGIYFGVLGMLIVLYVLLGTWLRDGGMLAYAGYVVSLFFIYLGLNGYTAVVFAPTTPWVSDAVLRIGIIGELAVDTLMWSLLLNLKRHFPRIGTLYLSISGASTCLLPFAASPYYRIIAPLILQVGILVAVASMALLAIIWRRQRTWELLLYLYAFTVMALGALFQITMTLGWLPQSFLTTNAYQASSLVNVLIMSFGLAMRMRQIQRGKAQAEQETVIARQRANEQRIFTAMLSHEFRNPLAAIDRAAQMILLKLPAMPPAEAARMATIRTGVGALSALVDSFLMSEALGHRTIALSLEACPIRPLLEEAMQALGETVGERVALTVTPPEATYLLDQTLIGMAVGNLLGNALRYSPSDSQVELSAIVDDHGLTIRVADHGCGLSKEELAMLGMPYYRASSSVGKKGSGLGYYFSRRIVEAHGGSLQADCPPGKGLEVAIRLPAEQNNRETFD